MEQSESETKHNSMFTAMISKKGVASVIWTVIITSPSISISGHWCVNSGVSKLGKLRRDAITSSVLNKFLNYSQLLVWEK